MFEFLFDLSRYLYLEHYFPILKEFLTSDQVWVLNILAWIFILIIPALISTKIPHEKTSRFTEVILGLAITVLGAALIYYLSMFFWVGLYKGFIENDWTKFATSKTILGYQAIWLSIENTMSRYVGSWWNEILILIPYTIMLLFSLFNQRSIFLKVLRVVIITLCTLWFFKYLALARDQNPTAFIFIAGLMLLMGLWSEVMTNSVVKRLWGSVQLEGIQKNFGNRRWLDISILIGQCSYLIIIYLVWFGILIAVENVNSLLEMFSTAVVTMLGFVALVHGFSHKELKASPSHAKVSGEVSVVFKLLAFSLIFIFSIKMFFSLVGANFAILENSAYENLFAIAFAMCFFCVTVAIGKVISLFIAIVDVVDVIDESEGNEESITVLIDETKTSEDYRTSSATITGLSKFHTRMREIGSNTVAYTQANMSEIARLDNLVIVLPKFVTQCADTDIAFYQALVNRGDVLIITTSSEDQELKEPLLSAFDIRIRDYQSTDGSDYVAIEKPEDFKKDFAGQFKATLKNPVSFYSSDPSKFKVLATSLSESGGNDELNQPLIIQKQIGKGQVICIGGANLFENEGFQSFHVDYVEYLFSLASSSFDVDNRRSKPKGWFASFRR